MDLMFTMELIATFLSLFCLFLCILILKNVYGSKKEQLKARLFLKAKSARVSAIAASFAFLILIIHRIEQLLDIAELELISQITLISFYALMGISLFSLNNSLKSGKYSE